MTLLQHFLPEHQFSESDAVTVQAPAAAVLEGAAACDPVSGLIRQRMLGRIKALAEGRG